MKKAFFILKIFLIVVLSILVLFFVVNFLLFVCINKSLKSENGYMFKRENFSIEKFMNSYNFKEPVGLEYKDKPSVIIFGCGFVNDMFLNKDESLDFYLSQNIKKPVYNRGVGGGGIQHAIIQVQSHKLDEIIKNSTNAIFLIPAINDNIRLRVYPGPLIDSNFLLNKYLYLRFIEDKNHSLILYKTKHPLIKGSILYRLFSKIIGTTLYTRKFQKWNLFNRNLNFIELHIKTLNRELKNINPNIKLTVLLYFDTLNDALGLINNLEKEEISVIDIKTLSDIDVFEEPKYRSGISKNPTGEAWKIFAPIIAKKLNL